MAEFCSIDQMPKVNIKDTNGNPVKLKLLINRNQQTNGNENPANSHNVSFALRLFFFSAKHKNNGHD